jgi:hypothetical protein
VARSVDVHEVELGFAAVAADRVVRGCVDVPALEVHGLVVVGETRVRGPVAVVGESEGRAVTPVVEVTGYIAQVIVKAGHVVERETVAEGEGNRGLLGSDLTEAVFWIDPDKKV